MTTKGQLSSLLKRMLIRVYPLNWLLSVRSSWSRGKILAGMPGGRAGVVIAAVAETVPVATVVVAASGSVMETVTLVVGTEAKASEDSVRTKERPGSTEKVVTAVVVLVTVVGVLVTADI